jgi:phenylacetate-CoA ligase
MISSLVYRFRNRMQLRQVADFEVRQWLHPDALCALGDQLAKNLAIHAAKSAPYYETLFRQMHFDPRVMDVHRDWERIPLLSKHILRNEFDSLLSKAVKGHNGYINHTGGSTGIPVRFVTDWQQFQNMAAWLDFVSSWAGWRPGELRFELWGNKEQRLPPTLWDRARASLSGHFTVPVYSYAEREIELWWQALSRLKPTIIYAYPSVVADFARWLDAEHHRPQGVKGVFCSAEVLYVEQRKIIEKVFCCKVYNQYGSRETPCLACECPEGNMHVFVDLNRVEYVCTEECYEENKEIVVTPLYNYVQPLLRYQIGDMGQNNEHLCSCGRGYPLMRLNVARSRDFLFGTNGKKIYPGFFTRLMDKEEWVRVFQFVQKKRTEILINIVPNGEQCVENRKNELVHTVNNIIKDKMGQDMNVSVLLVKNIDRTTAGKHRFVVNEAIPSEGYRGEK